MQSTNATPITDAGGLLEGEKQQQKTHQRMTLESILNFAQAGKTIQLARELSKSENVDMIYFLC